MVIAGVQKNKKNLIFVRLLLAAVSINGSMNYFESHLRHSRKLTVTCCKETLSLRTSITPG